MADLCLNKILNQDAREGLKGLPDQSVNCCVTSPPYFGLRDYGMQDQIGLEETPGAYVAEMVAVFGEVKRILRDDGTLWLNIGDSYASTAQGTYGSPLHLPGLNKDVANARANYRPKLSGIKPKDMIGIPWMLAFALRADGWYLRQDIIWAKPNPMPESVTDRPTKAHEYIFLLSKSPRYYYDYESIRTEPKDSSLARWNQDLESQVGSDRVPGKTNGNMKAVGGPDKQRGHSRRHAGFNDRWDNMTTAEQVALGANKRSVWNVATKPFSDAHFATFPEELIVDCIKAGCPIDGVVLDPFMGAGTTALVARKLNRNFIGFELNPDYVRIAEKRLFNELGMFQ